MNRRMLVLMFCAFICVQAIAAKKCATIMFNDYNSNTNVTLDGKKVPMGSKGWVVFKVPKAKEGQHFSRTFTLAGTMNNPEGQDFDYHFRVKLGRKFIETFPDNKRMFFNRNALDMTILYSDSRGQPDGKMVQQFFSRNVDYAELRINNSVRPFLFDIIKISCAEARKYVRDPNRPGWTLFLK